MKVSYLVEIIDPHLHIVRVSLSGQRTGQDCVSFFLPSWSPGSYLMREYSRNIRWMRATQENGEVLWLDQTAKGEWAVDWKRSMLKRELPGFTVSYEIYLHELTVRTSHVDTSHAFLHGPSYLIGIKDQKISPEIEFRFPPLWSKLATSLSPVDGPREKFIYEAPDYDTLVDCPVEIGCHESDGFLVDGIPHHIAQYGDIYPHPFELKKDFQKTIEHVAKTMGGCPFIRYHFITHFVPKIYGGLEHLDSTALQFDGRRLSSRKDYLAYLALAAHEYFHAWNVKRIRPRELGPFDYLNEGYTTMLWLAEGLTSCMDDWFVYRAGVATLEEFLDVLKDNLEAYYATPGRKFHSLEDSSFNAWIKLYRPDENSKNSSISYYLKGGLVFLCLHAEFLKKGKHLDHLLQALWQAHLKRPEMGLTREEVYAMVKEIGGADVLTKFSTMVETTQEIDFDDALMSMGLEPKWAEGPQSWSGFDLEFSGDRAIVKAVLLDSPAQKAGFNAGDEIIALGGLRVLREDVEKWGQHLRKETSYEVLVSRLGKLTTLSFIPGSAPRSLKELAIKDRALAEKAFRTA